MDKLGAIASKIRSKNAGPFWLTIDIFCETSDSFNHISQALKNGQIAEIFDMDEADLKRFDINDLNVVKFSLPRPEIQGSLNDRDMHGASWAALVAEIEI